MNLPPTPLLEVAGLRLDLGGRRILEDVSLTLANGEFLGLIGPNGGGKTSLLRVLLGLHVPTTGTVRWHPRPGGPPRLGYVPQRTNVDRNYPLSALEVLMTAPEVLLLDEPTAGLDTDGQQQFGTLLYQLNQEGVAIVLVSHDIPLVQGHAQRIACLNRTLHWHGRTAELDQQVINQAFFCELEKFRAQPSPKPRALEAVE
jgi:zinc transport system ATP-binding protein